MLNDAATKLVARVARAAARENKDRLSLGANVDQLALEAWETAQAQNPDFRDWPSALAYFEEVFSQELARDGPGRGNRSLRRGKPPRKAPDQKYRSFRATLPPLIYDAVYLVEDGEKGFSEALARCLMESPTVQRNIAFIAHAQT